ncbi:hypothetical protein BD769DRAFT_1368302 [Suillus cothurnatus]|nr:hypothetical protein BD769DRAFT_1368302 [Suillus cothurnatus]
MVLKDGQIIEQGSHRELLELSGLLASMWQTRSAHLKIPKPKLDMTLMTMPLSSTFPNLKHAAQQSKSI